MKDEEIREKLHCIFKSKNDIKNFRDLIILLMIVINVCVTPFMIALYYPGELKTGITPHTGEVVEYIETGELIVWYFIIQSILWAGLWYIYYSEKDIFLHPRKHERFAKRG